MGASGFLLMDLGVAEYDAVYAKQLELVEKKKKHLVSYDYLLFVEHPDVYTYGRKSKEKPGELDDMAHAFFVERGGEVTFHNPGQLVCYPILQLKEGERDIHKYLRRLEATLIAVLKDFGLEGSQRPGFTGVWVKEGAKKIASIGVAASSWVTYHGTALNVENDLEGFSRVRPCGLDSTVMTSMKQELGNECPRIQDVKDSFLRHFSTQFERLLMI